ncbi:Hint domain-containing protein [Methylobacterium sp. J-068]|uniref:Hint domain-containing protein n=1 Tax=Methylobacterium sp. J-068 TaxID=2836649 RepID=UPI001FBBCC51|nr:Hint domain-containing protein [Methylobacterium sp. J-068]MCJ2035239.1 Hint domain-containing protein [Methylobacterium sp. J-068]
MPQTIPSGTQSSTSTVATADTYTLEAGATRTQTAGTALQATVPSGSTTIDIEGTLNDTASGARAIRAALANGQILVGANGSVRALDGDAVQQQAFTGANAAVTSTVNLTNLGQIISDTSVTAITSTGATPPSAAYALNYNAAVGATNAPASDVTSGGVITNGSTTNTTALIQSNSGDAIRLGAHQTLNNYGVIRGAGPVNDAATNNTFSNTSTTQRYDISRGVRINAASSTNDTINNYGLIDGAQHGVDVGNTAATNIVVNNLAGGQIIGRNGSGVGADTTGTDAGTVQVTNAGLIRGAYAPTFDRAGLATTDGDGDGVDIDGGATIVNLAGGTIEGTGAGGYDSNGRLNNSEGISIGGGTVTNSGTIRGATYGIVVNNDSNADGSRSGVTATRITNASTGTITGQNGYAIRLENKTGTAADNDTLVNAGTITGTGTIPSGTVLRQDGLADPGTVGTLDGVTYTAANAGSARFIRGDGSAIQTGEGNDTVSNYGTITGNTGRALNLEGGNDTLNLYTGSSVAGRIDGGAGTDTLNLRLDDRTGADAGLGPNSGVTAGSLANVVNVEALSVQGGTWTVQDSQAYTSGITVAASAGLTVGTGGALSGNVANTGTLTFARTGDLAETGTVSGQGRLVQAGSGNLTLSGANTYSGGTTIQAGSTLTLGGAATYDGTGALQSAAAGTGQIGFSSSGGATGRLVLPLTAQPTNGTFSNTLANFGAGNEIAIAGLTNATVSFNSTNSSITVTGARTGASVSQTFKLTDPRATGFTTRDDGNGGTVVLVCFTTGTGIRIVRDGIAQDVAVENLIVGDRAVTATGHERPIRWIGHRDLVGRDIDGRSRLLPPDQQPIRIRTGAFGPDAKGLARPVRDLRLSPGHPVLVGHGHGHAGGVLVPAMCLVNGTTITRESVTRVTYWHVELDAHDILLAEGLAAESYLDWGDRPFFDEASDHALHNPDFVVPGLAARCRPVALDGPLVEAERARLSAVFAGELAAHCAWGEASDLSAWA